jgi:hypothetical protein
MNNDDVLRHNNAFAQEKAAWDWLQAGMPSEIATALRNFTALNPSYRGAEWWDILSILRDSDSHLDVIEPMAEAMSEWGTLQSFVVLTLCYSSRAFYNEWTTAERIIAVRATIDNNGGAK